MVVGYLLKENLEAVDDLIIKCLAVNKNVLCLSDSSLDWNHHFFQLAVATENNRKWLQGSQNWNYEEV